VALGDSLSKGVQPNARGVSVETSDGYANQLFTALHQSEPALRLADFGCPGETTASMVRGGICAYRAGSQLTAAAGFLRAHRGRVSLITVDIGANDLNFCLTAANIPHFGSCISKSLATTTANLTKIMTEVRAVGGHARIIAMNYYLPELAEWRKGFLGQLLARAAEVAATSYNNVLTKVYNRFGIRVADVFGAFHTSDFGNPVTVPGYGRLPRNVAAICQWTWQCAGPPRGPNQHANQAGYSVIAHAFMLADAGLATRRPT
jgi:lysophospholipase L1-like esterase